MTQQSNLAARIEEWHIARDRDGLIVVSHPAVGGCVSDPDGKDIASTILYHLAESILTAPASVEALTEERDSWRRVARRLEEEKQALARQLTTAPVGGEVEALGHEMCAAVAAIQFALEADEGVQFLHLWNEGEFAVIREEWPEAPDAVFIGADPLHKPRPQEDGQ